MARDYRNQRRYRGRSTRRSNTGVIWVMTGLVVALFIGGLFYLKQHSIKITEQRAVKAEKKVAVDSKKTKPHQANSNAATKPEFDFYTLLPQAQVQVPKQTPPPPPVATATPSKPVAAPAATPAPAVAAASKPAPAGNYTLQIAAVRDAKEAERIKAELTLMGFTPTVIRVTVNRVVWNRITLGPYSSIKLAEADQKRLHDNQINSILVRPRG